MMSKKSYEKKLREEEEATAHVFQDFLTSFQCVSNTPSKVFIKSGILNPNQPAKTADLPESQIYRPKPVISNKDTSLKTALECAKILKDTKVLKNKNKEKPRSNLELLKEEIKQRQLVKEDLTTVVPAVQSDGYDLSSTNLFIANLNPKVSEDYLMLLFGKFGALASVKIMWPRGEEKFRNFPNTNCGFVAFMSRRDAERALHSLEHRDDMRISWGKCVEIPPQPIYVPPELTKLYLPPPYSGLPFNAQPIDPNFEKPTNNSDLEFLLSKSIVKVTIPLDKRLVCIIHRMVEFVVREGPLFEALIMMNEANNPDFSFLFDNKSPMHVYYRWKLFSILNGDGQKSWSSKPFRMVKDGPVWIPPVAIDYRAGMPQNLISTNDEEVKNNLLSKAQCSRLMDLIKHLNLSRTKILAAMSFCLNHQEAIRDSLNIIFDSLKNVSTHPLKKVSRLFLLSDIFWNCKKKKVKIAEQELYDDLKEIFQNFQTTYSNLIFKIDKENLKTRVLSVLRSWNSGHLFSLNFIETLEELFVVNEINEEEDFSSDEPLDGANLLKRTLMKNNDINIVPKTDKNFFINSAWNQVDPKDLESQAMSTQKLFELEMFEENKEKKKKKKRKKKEIPVTISSKWDDSDNEH
ncbi:hypothetical protein HHI36_006756 [Cryptolaemus montrouzieri]|uniref:U2 snRNP-associated SURP motif-containing protein n=1 Tax=Cryptolaemus montrouzieri TaxID=559131 RepID=A0ABD2NZ18_9CUCU